MAEEFFFKKHLTLIDIVRSKIENKLSIYIYNNIVSVITHKFIKKILEYNIVQYLFVQIGWEYKILLIIILIL